MEVRNRKRPGHNEDRNKYGDGTRKEGKTGQSQGQGQGRRRGYLKVVSQDADHEYIGEDII